MLLLLLLLLSLLQPLLAFLRLCDDGNVGATATITTARLVTEAEVAATTVVQRGTEARTR